MKAILSKLTTSKQLAWTIIIFYIIAFFSVEIIYVIYDKELFELFSYILPLPMTVVVSYFGKSGFENYYKIKGACEQSNNTEYQEEEQILNEGEY